MENFTVGKPVVLLDRSSFPTRTKDALYCGLVPNSNCQHVILVNGKICTAVIDDLEAA